ncbi:MAG: winged helix-turn-helix transcriptional regulator [Pusillimonas sp.]|nr:winged helix-turn-helix transcriptional regulator [Pusillimonas sp.]
MAHPVVSCLTANEPSTEAGEPEHARKLQIALGSLTPEVRALLDNFQLDTIVSHLLRRAHFFAEDLFAQEFSRDAITPRQKAALIVVYQNPGLNQNALADRLVMDRNTIADMVKRLVAGKLLLRVKSKSNQRANQLYLAPAGANLLNHVMPRDREIEAALLARLPQEYRPLFLKCLKLIAGAQTHPTDNIN